MGGKDLLVKKKFFNATGNINLVFCQRRDEDIPH